MNWLPIIVRELRSQARQTFTYWLRTFGVGAILFVAALLLNEDLVQANAGGRLFGLMHCLSYLAIWVFVPLAAANCISQERREGTLGLLFLTRLRPFEIVFAKIIAHGLRTATLILATIPALTIPFLLGGVSWTQAGMAVVMWLNAGTWALAAAITASALGRSSAQSIGWAMLLVAIGFIFYSWSVGALLGMNSQTTWTAGYSQAAYDFFVGISITAMPQVDLNLILRVLKPGQLGLAIGISSVGTIAVFSVAIIFVANRIRCSWQDEPPSVRRQQINRALFRPVVAVGLLRRWMKRKLEHNPIGWLEQRSWQGRLVSWTWLAVMISIYSLVLTQPNVFSTARFLQSLTGWLLVLSMMIAAAGSFRRERESGVMELLLVAPLTSRQIIGGRLRGLWGQFLPSLVLLLGIWTYLMSLASYRAWYGPSSDASELVVFAVSFVVVPMIGLYFSLRCRHLIYALLGTGLMVFVIPLLLDWLVSFLFWAYTADNVLNTGWRGPALGHPPSLFFQGAFALILLRRLQRRLEQRAFNFQRLT